MEDALFDSIDAVTTEVLHEVARAKTTFLPFNSAHEGYAVLREEIDELWDEVKKNQRIRDKATMRKEAIQCAAMAVRFVMDVCDQRRNDDPLPVTSTQAVDAVGLSVDDSSDRPRA